MVAEARKGSAAWIPVRSRLADSLATTLAQHPEELLAALLHSVQSTDPRQRVAGLGALRSAMSAGAEALAPDLLPALRPLLDMAEHDALTTKEVRIFFTPGSE